MDSTQADLLARLEAFPLDEPDAILPFSRRLARENGWSPAFAERAVGEYRRFVFLAMCAGHPVTPSEAVDQVWHLHLCYSESYWQRLCRDVLGRPLHHGPTRGGRAEHEKHCDWYEKTLASYRRLLGAEPPAEIWPSTDGRFRDAAAFVRINTRENWVIPKPRWWAAARLAGGLLGIALLVSGCQAAWLGTFPLFDLSGPNFIRFFLIFAPAVFLACGLLRAGLREQGVAHSAGEFDGEPFKIACLAGGPVRALTTALVTLRHRRMIRVAKGGTVERIPGVVLPADADALERKIFDGLPASGAETLAEIRSRVQEMLDRTGGSVARKRVDRRRATGESGAGAAAAPRFAGAAGRRHKDHGRCGS